jgi:opacity protein-like surface antigen
MKKFVLATVAAGTLLSAPAFAADMAVKARPPALSPAFDWSGFYIGGDLGWQGSRIGLSSPSPAEPLSFTPNHDGFAGGGFVGIQKQFNQVVVGIEGSYLAATGHESFGTPSIGPIFSPGGTANAQAKLKDLWSIGARVGLPFGQWMPYVAGGYGSGSFQLNAQNTVGAVTETATSRNSGGYVGGGVDYAFTKNWIIGAEYRHYFFDNKTVTPAVSGAILVDPTTFSTRTDTVLARLSYKFNFMQ